MALTLGVLEALPQDFIILIAFSYIYFCHKNIAFIMG